MDYRRQGFSPCLSLLMSSFSLLIAPPGLTAGLLSKASDCSGPEGPARWTPFSQNAPLPLLAQPEASARGLSPVTSSPQDNLPRPVSYYAFFKGWLLLSQPPGCLGLPTSFPTEPQLRDLSWRSGLFPSRPRTLAPMVCLPRCTRRYSEFG